MANAAVRHFVLHLSDCCFLLDDDSVVFCDEYFARVLGDDVEGRMNEKKENGRIFDG